MAITGKQRSRRIDRSYTAVVDPSIRWKRFLGLAGLALGVVYGVWMLSELGKKQMSAGELSKAHHAWNDTGCNECHTDYTPIKPTAFGYDATAILKNNNKCKECHPWSDHYSASMLPEKLELESCVQCHHEHLGFNHDLNNIADESCVRCHKDLSQYVQASLKNHAKITSFDAVKDAGHPEFPTLDSSVAKDTGTISFSHIQHMRLGQPRKPGDATAKSWKSLGDRFKDQYKADAKTGLIQLSCGDCHERDQEMTGYEAMEVYVPGFEAKGLFGNGGAITPQQSNTHFLYKPIEFSKHCEACHRIDIPHKLDFKDLDYLTDVVRAEQLQQMSRSSRMQDINLDPQDEDNRRTELSSSGGNLASLLKADPSKAKNTLFLSYGCNKCHQFAADGEPNAQKIVMDSGIKSQWLKDATFKHGSHMNVNCQECHNMDLSSDKAPDDKDPPLGGLASQILIGGIETCRNCHIKDETNRAHKQAKKVNVATADCIDCHRYHHDPTKTITTVVSKIQQAPQAQGATE